MEITIGHEMDVAAEDVWHVAGEEFSDLTWSGDITHSELEGTLGVGAVRVCHFEPNMFSKEGLVREELTLFDRSRREFAYRTELGGIMGTVSNHWTIVALSETHSETRMRATIEVRGWLVLATPLLRLMLCRMGRQTLRELEEAARQRRANGVAASGVKVAD